MYCLQNSACVVFVIPVIVQHSVPSIILDLCVCIRAVSSELNAEILRSDIIHFMLSMLYIVFYDFR